MIPTDQPWAVLENFCQTASDLCSDIPGAQALPVQANVTQPAEMEALAQKTWDAFGAAHLIINNAWVALVTDLVPAKRLGTDLLLFNATNWIGLILGSALYGAAIQRMGITPALLLAALLALLAIVLVIPFRWNGAAATSAAIAVAAVSIDGSI